MDFSELNLRQKDGTFIEDDLYHFWIFLAKIEDKWLHIRYHKNKDPEFLIEVINITEQELTAYIRRFPHLSSRTECKNCTIPHLKPFIHGRRILEYKWFRPYEGDVLLWVDPNDPTITKYVRMIGAKENKDYCDVKEVDGDEMTVPIRELAPCSEITCVFCGKKAHHALAHKLKSRWVGHDCCWTEEMAKV